jgi:hypothetical protein
MHTTLITAAAARDASDNSVRPAAAQNVELWPVERLVPYANNPRRNDAAVDQMIASIQEFGFKIPVLARSNGEVVDGHLRLKAALKVGLEQIQVWPIAARSSPRSSTRSRARSKSGGSCVRARRGSRCPAPGWRSSGPVKAERALRWNWTRSMRT